jgi:hypothetical protein
MAGAALGEDLLTGGCILSLGRPEPDKDQGGGKNEGTHQKLLCGTPVAS